MNIQEIYKKALQDQAPWLTRWENCKKYTNPENDTDLAQLFDSTAADAAELLANSIFSIITPPESEWFGLSDDNPMSIEEQSPENAIKQHLNTSNFYTIMHQAYLDLIVLGTACVLFSENPIGAASAFNFQSIPMKDIAIIRDTSDNVSATFYTVEMTVQELTQKYPNFVPPMSVRESWKTSPETKVKIVQGVVKKNDEWELTTWADIEGKIENNTLETGKFKMNPFVIFRWSAYTGETYGRSPVMRALPDIKTANKVVELILKNASISVAGIWQADDDGVINLSNINLVPGAIIPKAVGSSGLTPLRSGADFDVSQLVLGDLRARIKSALLADKLEAFDAKVMTATEVLARNTNMLRALGAAYGRLLFEMITPIAERGLYILSRRGQIKDVKIGGNVKIRCVSPISRLSGSEQASQVINWLTAINEVGMTDMVDMPKTFMWLADTLHIPKQLFN